MGLFWKPSRREFLRGAGLAMAATALAGCARPPAKPAGKGDAKGSPRTGTQVPAANKIRLVYARPTGAEYSILGQVAKSFGETSEGARYQVEDLAISGDLISRLRALEASGTAPDVHIQQDEMIPDWAREGLLLSLDPLLLADPKFDLGDFYERSLANARYRGQLWALPVMCAGSYLFINKDLFQAAGVALPKPDWRWEEYKAAAIALTMPGLNQWGATPLDSWAQMAERIWQNGAEVFDAPKTRCLLNQPGAMEAMGFWADLALVDKAAPDASAVGAGGASRLFLSGKLAMYEDGLWALQGWKQARFKWGLVYLPYQRRRINLLTSGSQAISAHTQQPSGAWQLLKHITGPEAMRTYSSTLKVPCARKSVDSKMPYVDPSIDIDWSLVQQGVEGGRLLDVTAKNDQVARLLDNLLRSIMAGRQSVKEAVDQTVPKINELVAPGAGG